MIQSEYTQDRRVKIVNCDRIFYDLIAQVDRNWHDYITAPQSVAGPVAT